MRILRESRCALLAGSALFPGLAATATLVVYLADWPAPGDGAALFGVGVAIGAGTWLVFSLLFCRALTRPESASPGIHGELCVRLGSVAARLDQLEAAEGSNDSSHGLELGQVRGRLQALERRLGATGDENCARGHSSGSCLAWLLGYGYVNAWREVHRSEEALLQLESKENVYAAAVMDLTRLRASSIEGGMVLAERLSALVAHGPQAEAPRRVDDPLARTLVRHARFTLNRHRNGIWEQLINLRNRVFATMVYTGTVAYVVLALSVVAEAERASVTAAVAFYLVGAIVGLFGELYGGTRQTAGAVSDYGLAMVRLLATPLLSGIAAVGGVLLTRVGGSAAGDIPPLEDIFSLAEYPAGIVVAAIFGLTPGLLLERLRARTEEYKEELARSGIGGDAEVDGCSSS